MSQQSHASLSMETVARAAGVSTSTVSRALRGDPRISEATRRRVTEASARLGYRMNPLVSALMTQLRDRSPPAAKCNLAWLNFYSEQTGFSGDPVHHAFIRGATERAREAGYALDIIHAAGCPAPRLTRLLRNRGIQGVLLPYFDGCGGRAASIPLPLEEFAIVGVGMRFEYPGLHYASDDQYESGRLAVENLWELGYRRIGYVGERRIEAIVNGRFCAGCNATLQTQLGGRALVPLLTDELDEVRPWLRRTRVEAIVTASRRLPAHLLRQGVRTPGDIGIAHLNVDDVESLTPGAIAGIRQDNSGVGANAADLLISLVTRNEIGVPLHPRGIQIHGVWVPGASAVRQGR